MSAPAYNRDTQPRSHIPAHMNTVIRKASTVPRSGGHGRVPSSPSTASQQQQQQLLLQQQYQQQHYYLQQNPYAAIPPSSLEIDVNYVSSKSPGGHGLGQGQGSRQGSGNNSPRSDQAATTPTTTPPTPFEAQTREQAEHNHQKQQQQRPDSRYTYPHHLSMYYQASPSPSLDNEPTSPISTTASSVSKNKRQTIATSLPGLSSLSIQEHSPQQQHQ
ncbi:hypothetical protein BGZ73_006936, partial [Actinomortierella ambigua]